MEPLLIRDRFDNYLYKMTPEPVSTSDVVCGSFLGPNNNGASPRMSGKGTGRKEPSNGDPFVRLAHVPFTGQQTIA
jgi:hypothetical protein